MCRKKNLVCFLTYLSRRRHNTQRCTHHHPRCMRQDLDDWDPQTRTLHYAPQDYLGRRETSWCRSAPALLLQAVATWMVQWCPFRLCVNQSSRDSLDTVKLALKHRTQTFIPHTHTHTHTRELILIGSNVGPSSVGLVHTWDPIELC